MADKPRFLVRFWGVRGSYPTPGPNTIRHGGNTSCVEIQAGTHTLIFDAGSGIIRLGEALTQQSKDAPTLNLALFVTHAHHDHLLGFPFFSPLFDARTHLYLFGPQLGGQDIEHIITSLMSPPHFPVDVRSLPSHRSFETVDKNFCITWNNQQSAPEHGKMLQQQQRNLHSSAEVRVTGQFTPAHPSDGAIIYGIEYAGRKVIYATDVEWKDGCTDDFVHFVEGADLLIHDAQYTAQDYQQGKHGFGHSTIQMATTTARKAHVKSLVLFHHEPTYNDTQLDQMETEARTYFASTRSAYEGMAIDLLEQKEENYESRR
ncbi:MAG TPA: MBL fold metallo-hydrolase [Ktedonobacteraceae bacterium]|jgi:phosphoribosyl 1,2-cyclic phosphodiesterase|nr:MBL fold metallo-hydrolase [Ktedonobacteraceae bacterium]